jgi:hypothetical protein
LPFCDQCGRGLEPIARFCDLCGSSVAFEAEPPSRQPAPFCDQCGRGLEPFARFCDSCGTNVAFQGAPPSPKPVASILKMERLQDWSSYTVVKFPEPTTSEPRAPESARVESRPVEPWPPTQADKAQTRPVRARRLHVSRRTLAFSAGVIALAILTLIAIMIGLWGLP